MSVCVRFLMAFHIVCDLDAMLRKRLLSSILATPLKIKTTRILQTRGVLVGPCPWDGNTGPAQLPTELAFSIRFLGVGTSGPRWSTLES